MMGDIVISQGPVNPATGKRTAAVADSGLPFNLVRGLVAFALAFRDGKLSAEEWADIIDATVEQESENVEGVDETLAEQVIDAALGLLEKFGPTFAEEVNGWLRKDPAKMEARAAKAEAKGKTKRAERIRGRAAKVKARQSP